MPLPSQQQAQMCLVPPPVAVLDLKVGLDLVAKRFDVGSTVRDASDHTVLGMSAHPFARYATFDDVAALVTAIVLEQLRLVLDPDPF